MNLTVRIKQAEQELREWEGRLRYAAMQAEQMRGKLAAYRELDSEKPAVAECDDKRLDDKRLDNIARIVARS